MPSRRQFLLAQAAPAVDLDVPRSAAGSYLNVVSRRAMACQFQVFLNATEPSQAVDAAILALEVVEQLEAQLSVYRADSEVSQLNRSAWDGPVEVEPGLFALLEACQQFHRETDGAFDVTSAPLSRAWGFLDRQGRLPTADEIAAAAARVGSQWMHLDRATKTVRFERPLEINLGSIGKGYALDRCARTLKAWEVDEFLIHGGHSSVLAAGDRCGNAAGGWIVNLRHPQKPEASLGQIRLRDRSLATSGAANQYFHHRGRRYGHVLDPRSGKPVDHLLSVTAVAPTATQADALATAFYVLGLDAIEDYCVRHPEVGAVAIRAGQRGGAVELLPLGSVEFQATDGPAPV